MKLSMQLNENSYDILLGENTLYELSQWIDPNRKIMIIRDSGVPKEYADILIAQFPYIYSYVIPQGEASKSLSVYEAICHQLITYEFTRQDMIFALGGGVVGDISGFVAATYMRGIPLVQIPTTTLSQIDSSIGGKTAINFHGHKNMLGSFYQPKLVCIDWNTLHTLPKRHIVNGLIEALKAGLIYDASILPLFEDDVFSHIHEIIYKAIQVKKAVVEQDEKEQGLRKILNFGHTIGHAIEASYGESYFHGECVAIGMCYFIEDPVLKQRVLAIYDKLGLSFHDTFDTDALLEHIRHDKKATGDHIDVITVKEAGSAQIVSLSLDEIKQRLEETKR